MDKIERAIPGLGSIRKYARGEELFRAGDEAEGFFLVLSGVVRVFKMDAMGNEIEIVRLREGDFFGEAVCFAAAPFPAFARAVTDTSVRYLPGRDVFRRIGRDPDSARFFIDLLARKCLTLNAKVEALGLRTVRQRLARYLLAGHGGDGEYGVCLEIGKGELARELGTIPETLSRTLNRMSRDGLIEVNGKTVLVKDPSGLRRIDY
jgi:CRP/FNR family transcriptional regulator, dissimilatory nitrate respiration regulator